MMKLALMRTATGKEDPEFIGVNCISDCSPNKSSSNRRISTSTLQRRLRESGIQDGIAAKKPQLKDTNNKKRLAGPRNTSNGH